MNRPLLTALVALAVSAGMAAPAFAGPEQKRVKDRTIDFEGDTIQAEYMKPEQMTIEAINKKKNQGFIKIRTDFFKEIVRSAEDL